jgi:hypothetical protein
MFSIRGAQLPYATLVGYIAYYNSVYTEAA